MRYQEQVEYIPVYSAAMERAYNERQRRHPVKEPPRRSRAADVREAVAAFLRQQPDPWPVAPLAKLLKVTMDEARAALQTMARQGRVEIVGKKAWHRQGTPQLYRWRSES